MTASTMFLAACGGPQELGEPEPDPNSTRRSGNEILSIGGRLFSIPSPIQAALAIREAGLQYQKDLTTPLEEAEGATGKVAEAALLGVFGADLAYVTVHQDGQRAMATLQVIEKLAARLELSNAFDRTLMDQFRNNMNNEDSLLRFSGKAFSAADRYLKTNQREDVSTLLLAGGWVQSLYLTLADPNATTNEKLLSRIGDQKATLDALIELISNTDMDQSAKPLLDAMRSLRQDFDGVTRTYTYATPVTDAANKTTYINSTSTVTLAPGTVDAIRTKLGAIRTLILA